MLLSGLAGWTRTELIWQSARIIQNIKQQTRIVRNFSCTCERKQCSLHINSAQLMRIRVVSCSPKKCICSITLRCAALIFSYNQQDATIPYTSTNKAKTKTIAKYSKPNRAFPNQKFETPCQACKSELPCAQFVNATACGSGHCQFQDLQYKSLA
uniref:Uncharacterized protein n=1 Tax=Spironucleus salmonicida TaxID=348837 RepID=V6LTM6_9EUKA|eukprot:EST48002.1 Hypothetical protein SS50377_11921 [Spironucleus salmonicida]